MRFLQKSNIEKTIIVISDIHLGAGVYVRGKRNVLEDFHHDRELVSFFDYYCEGDYLNRDVELIINGDFFDFLAVPYVDFYDDNFWSEDASLQKLKIILDAHQEVIKHLIKFIETKKKTVRYIIGNHDAELILPSLRRYLYSLIAEKERESFKIILDSSSEYSPVDGVVIKHGHEYEKAHYFRPETSLVEDHQGKRYFIPPWGSYFVTRVINKFKQEREYINFVRPIRRFLINGLIYDTFFTLRFMFSTLYYFFVVRFISFIKERRKFKDIVMQIADDLELFQDYESLTREFFVRRKDACALIVGHTHDPSFRVYPEGQYFINTGTWTNMVNLDFMRRRQGPLLTYAQVDVKKRTSSKQREIARLSKYEHLDIGLYIWKGASVGLYDEF